MNPGKASNLSQRSAVLHEYNALAPGWHHRLDEFVHLAAQLCDTPLAALSFNDHSRERFVSCHGMTLDKLPLEKGFGDYVVSGGMPLLVNDARTDTRFPQAPLMSAVPGLRFYAGVPVAGADGVALGTLAVMDRSVRHLPQGKLDALAALGSRVLMLLDVEKRGAPSTATTSTVKAGTRRPDIQSVLSSVPGVHWLIEPEELRVVAVSDTALEALGLPRDAVLDQPLAAILANTDADSRETARKVLVSMKRVKKTGRPENLIAIPYLLPTPDGGVRQSYWTSVIAPVYRDDGKLAYLAHHSEDVTELMQLKEREGRAAKDRRTLEERARKMEADIVRHAREMERLNEHLRMAQNVANVGSWELGINGDPVRIWSDEVYSILGVKSKDYAAGDDLLLAAAHPDDRKMLLADREAAIRENKALELTHRIVRPDGSVRTVRQHARVALDGGGKPVKLYGTIQDITRQKQVEAELKTRARQQEVVAKLGQLALSEASLDDLRDEAVKVVAQTLDFEYCKILQLLPDKSALKIVAGVGWKKGLVGSATIGIERNSQAGFALMSGETVIVRDLRNETRFQDPPLLHDHGVVSGISVLIAGNDGPWGVLGAHTTRLRLFTRDDVNFFESVGHIVAEATHRARISAEMNARARQQAALSRLIHAALRGGRTRDLQDLAGALLAETLDVEYTKVTELLPDGSGMTVVAGAGWEDGVIGHTVLASGKDSHGGYVFRSAEPVTFTDVPTESRFRPTRLLFDHGVDSGISVAIRDNDKPLGILAAHTTRRRWFTDDEKEFISRVADILAEAMRRQ